MAEPARVTLVVVSINSEPRGAAKKEDSGEVRTLTQAQNIVLVLSAASAAVSFSGAPELRARKASGPG